MPTNYSFYSHKESYGMSVFSTERSKCEKATHYGNKDTTKSPYYTSLLNRILVLKKSIGIEKSIILTNRWTELTEFSSTLSSRPV